MVVEEELEDEERAAVVMQDFGGAIGGVEVGGENELVVMGESNQQEQDPNCEHHLIGVYLFRKKK